MKIVLSSSSDFFDRLAPISTALQTRHHQTCLPQRHALHNDPLKNLEQNLLRAHFDKIEISDALYVANFDKSSIAGYIGGSVFLEMGIAYHHKIPIFLMNKIPMMDYKQELIQMHTYVVGTDWEKLEDIYKSRFMIS